MSPVLTAAWQNALAVDPREVEQYVPTALDIGIAEALLSGVVSTQDIASFCHVSTACVTQWMRDPVAMRWISDQVTAHFHNRIGLVVSALFTRACTGDVAAVRLLFERFGQLVNRSEVVHHKGMDLSQMSDDDLSAILSDKLRTVKDVTFNISPNQGREGTADQGAGGEGAQES